MLHGTWACTDKPILLSQGQWYSNGVTGLELAHIWPAGSRMNFCLGLKEKSEKLRWKLPTLRGVEGPAGPTLLQDKAFYLQKSSQGFLWSHIWSPRGPEYSRGSNSLGALSGYRKVQQIFTVLLVSLIPKCRTSVKKYSMYVVTLRFTFSVISSSSEWVFSWCVCLSGEIILLRHINLLVLAVSGIIRKGAIWGDVHSSS